VRSELGRQGMRDKDLPGFFVYLEETLEKVQQSKSSYKHQIDLSDNKDITDKGVVDHLVPFLERWPECHRLKLYKTSCGEEAIKCLAPWVSMGYARELHLSDMGGQVSGDNVLRFLRQVHRGGKYPYQGDTAEAKCALWLRLEHNGIPSEEVVQKAKQDGVQFRVLDKSEILKVRPGVPSYNKRGKPDAIHLVLFHVQDVRIKRRARPAEPAEPKASPPAEIKKAAPEQPPAASKAAAKPASLPVAAGSAGGLANPGDTKNCKDFANYEEAKTWFDTYFPLYGDVAKLDGDGDGKPCESLLKKK